MSTHLIGSHRDAHDYLVADCSCGWTGEFGYYGDRAFIEQHVSEDGAAHVFAETEPTEECPTHGTQPITGHGATRGADPYATTRLACGDTVACFGPGEPNVIVR